MGSHPALRGGGTVDDTAFVQPSAYVNGDSSIDQWAYVGHGAVIYDRCYVATRTFIDDGAVLRHVQVGPFTTIGKGAIIGPDVTIGANCIICPGARVTTDVADGTTVTSDCCGGGTVDLPKFGLIGSVNYLFKGSWNQFAVDMFAAAATDDWTAAGEPAVPLEIAYSRPFLGADGYTCDRIVLSGYFSRNALAHVTDGLTLTLKKQSGDIGSATLDTDIVGAQNRIIDVSGPDILAVGDGLALVLNMNGGASPAGNFEVGFLVSLYHQNY